MSIKQGKEITVKEDITSEMLRFCEYILLEVGVGLTFLPQAKCDDLEEGKVFEELVCEISSIIGN